MDDLGVRIELGAWTRLKDDAAPIRLSVFVHEQQVPLEEEIDPMDEHCLHAVAFTDTGQAVATGRLLPDGHIGRMAVLASWRGQGLGRLVLSALIEQAEKANHRKLILHAQKHAVGFYQKYGFETQGSEFLEANIPHLLMIRTLG